MKRICFLAAFFLTFLSFFPAALFAKNKIENLYEGNSLTEYLIKNLKEKNYKPETQELTSTGQDEFARNLYLEFKTKSSENDDSLRNTLIFDFKQEDFYQYEEQIFDFLDFLRKSELSFNVTVLFSALTDQILPGIFSPIMGSSVFASQIADEDDCCAVTVDFDNTRRNSIYTGSYKSTSPLWLCRRTVEAFIHSKKDFLFRNVISSVYRLGLLRGEMRMTLFILADIPAVSVWFNSPDETDTLKTFVNEYSPEGTENWDQHYFFIPASHPLRPFFLSEKVFLIFCISLAVFTILLLCTFSFTGKYGEQNKYDLLKNLYVIPLTLLVSIGGLYAAQKISSSLTLNGFTLTNPVSLFGFKITLSLLFISILYGLHNFLKIPVDIFIYSYMIQFVALLNIFIFSAMDLMMFVPFAAEYLVIYLFRKVRNAPWLIIEFIVLLFPFIPYAVILLQQGVQMDLNRPIFTDFTGNLMLSLSLFPFQVLWLKILLRLEIFNRNKGYSIKKVVFNGAISTLSILAFTYLIIFLISNLVYKPAMQEAEVSKTEIITENQQTCSIKLTQNEFSGMNTNHITISSKIPALRYAVTVFSQDNSIPVYDSIYQYAITSVEDKVSSEKKEAVRFIIPDFPPQKIRIDYAASPLSKAKIEVQAFYRTENENIFRREIIYTETGRK